MTDPMGCAFFQQECANGTGFLYNSALTDTTACKAQGGFPLFFHNAQKLCKQENKQFTQQSGNSSNYTCCPPPVGTCSLFVPNMTGETRGCWSPRPSKSTCTVNHRCSPGPSPFGMKSYWQSTEQDCQSFLGSSVYSGRC